MADDDALQAALAQFNDGLKIQQAEEAAERAVGKAERKKQQAAADLKRLQGDPNASAEDKAAADEAYRAAVDEFNRLRSGEAPAEPAEEPAEGAEEPAEGADEPAEGADEPAEGADEPEEPAEGGEEPAGDAGDGDASAEAAGDAASASEDSTEDAADAD